MEYSSLNHLKLAQFCWNQNLLFGDLVLDATCGNGHDSLFLAEKILTQHCGYLWAMDIQETAIFNTQERLRDKLTPEQLKRTSVLKADHSKMPEEISFNSLKLVVYNLGYLPGGNKKLTTQPETTLQSLNQALTLICQGGMLSVTCYSGHDGGIEEAEVHKWAGKLPKNKWNVCLHQWINTRSAPSLLFIKKIS